MNKLKKQSELCSVDYGHRVSVKACDIKTGYTLKHPTHGKVFKHKENVYFEHLQPSNIVSVNSSDICLVRCSDAIKACSRSLRHDRVFTAQINRWRQWIISEKEPTKS